MDGRRFSRINKLAPIRKTKSNSSKHPPLRVSNPMQHTHAPSSIIGPQAFVSTYKMTEWRVYVSISRSSTRATHASSKERSSREESAKQ